METETNKQTKGLRGMDYYYANKDRISKQKREYRMKNIDKIKEQNRNKYLIKKQEEYKAKHDNSLEGFKIRQYNKFSG